MIEIEKGPVDTGYSVEFTQECRKNFGLRPEEIKHILVTLLNKGCIDIDKHFADVDKMRQQLTEGINVTRRLVTEVQESTEMIQAFKKG